MIFRILRKQLSCRQIAVILCRLVIIELLSLGLGILAVGEAYNTYWNNNPFQEQAVSSGILFPTVPLALSYAITNNQEQQVTDILNSNYGLLALVITDAEGKKIINYSHLF